jgi:toxin-antitoxin system PIN domain toxin
VTIPDVNILLYAYNADAPQHPAAVAWLKGLFDSGETIGLPWSIIWGFLRICTNPRLWPNPLPAQQAFEIIRGWIAEPGVVVIEPGPRHAEILEHLVIECRAGGPLVSDAVLAALALEFGATLASTDRDFGRFPDLRWVNPVP